MKKQERDKVKDKDMGEVIDEVLQREQRHSQALSIVLEEQREKDGHLFALSTRMGRVSSFVTTQALDWVAEKVRFAGDLPIFKGKVDETTKKVPVDEDTVAIIQQRQPDWRRQLPMALYLAIRKNHKFPPLLVVAYQDWIYDSKAEQWGPDGRAMQSSLTITPLEPKALYCDLDAKDTTYYTLDGQHRLMAIKGLAELLSHKGKLFALDADRNPKRNRSITRDQVIEQIQKESGEDEGTIHNRLEGLLSERIGIEIIPAVADGETYKEALFRLRSTFVDVNEKAKKLTKGEAIMLDENEGFRVVARNIMASHDLLKGKVDEKQAQLAETSECYTTLKTLVEIARSYLGVKPEFSAWKNSILGDKDLGFMRPDETELANGAKTLDAYFDALKALPSHCRFVQGKKADEIRSKDGEDNILFRPIAQVALAKAVGSLERDNEMSLESIMNELARQDKSGQLKLRDPRTPWVGVLCDPIDQKMRRKTEDEYLCSRLFRYLLGGGITDDADRSDLLEKFVEARRTGDNKAINIDGNYVSESEVQLPSPWR